MIKKLFKLLLLGMLVTAAMVAVGMYRNNADAPMPDQAALTDSLDRASQWLESNYDSLKRIENPILWWMVKQAAENSGHPALQKVYAQYEQEFVLGRRPSVWTPMFREYYRHPILDIHSLSNLKDYQILFVYGHSCDTKLENEPLIQKQLDENFCSLHYVHSRCMTHQLMGLRFMQQYGCGETDQVRNTIAALKDSIVDELTFDFRVGDAYIQRVTMLQDSGAGDRIKPVWIQRILDAQNPDGTWDDFHPLVSLPDGRMLALSSRWPALARPRTDLHATAQGIWLMSLLTSSN